MARFHVSKEELAADSPMPGFEMRTAELAQYTVAFESMPGGFPPPVAFNGLPDDACQCPHWGFLFKGTFRSLLTDGREVVVSAGEAYYLPPGHRFESLEPCDTVWFSPTNRLNETFDVVARNVEAYLGRG